MGSYNSWSYGPIELEDFFQALKQLWYMKMADRKSGTVSAARPLMCLKKSLNLIRLGH